MNETKLSNLYRINIYTEANQRSGIENHFAAMSDNDALNQAESYLGALDKAFAATIQCVTLFRVEYQRYDTTKTFAPDQRLVGKWKYEFRRTA